MSNNGKRPGRPLPGNSRTEQNAIQIYAVDTENSIPDYCSWSELTRYYPGMNGKGRARR